ncbi:hypothetical protein MTR67_043796, partial [Solanum verrucosum]
PPLLSSPPFFSFLSSLHRTTSSKQSAKIQHSGEHIQQLQPVKQPDNSNEAAPSSRPASVSFFSGDNSKIQTTTTPATGENHQQASIAGSSSSRHKQQQQRAARKQQPPARR